MVRIKHYDKRVGITYVYESESYYESENHQSRSKIKLIGKIDPEPGEMVPTGKKGRPSKKAFQKMEQIIRNNVFLSKNDWKNQRKKIKKLETR